jgi:cell division protein FtsI (penicillin-binding protein 3)
MRQMMQGVVLHGTGKKALLIGYTSAGKTGTAQKVDPATRAYSHTKYVATFAGFAPVNNPAVTIAVVLDSAVGLHQGGQVSAPVFNRIAQQVLEYLHTPHDIEIPANKTLLARAKVSDKDFEEGSPDHPGENIDELQPMADTLADSKPQQNSRQNESIKPPVTSGPAPSGTVVVAAMRQSEASAINFFAAAPVRGAKSHDRNGGSGCRTGRDCGPVICRQVRPFINRNRAGQRLGTQRRGQRQGTRSVSSRRLACRQWRSHHGTVWALTKSRIVRNHFNRKADRR